MCVMVSEHFFYKANKHECKILMNIHFFCIESKLLFFLFWPNDNLATAECQGIQTPTWIHCMLALTLFNWARFM